MTAKRRSATSRSSWACAWPAILALAGWSQPASCQSQPQIDVAIPATNLPAAIAELSRDAHVSIGSPGTLPRIRVNAVSGRQTVDQALDRLLAGTGYTARRVGRSAWRIERASAQIPPSIAHRVPVAELPPGEIVVTGSKRAQLLNDTPNSVTVFMPGSAMAASLEGTSTVARSLEGLTVAELGPGQNRVFLRGVADSAFGGRSQSTVAILFDDARLTYSAPDPDIRLVDVDRVEVLKGPQGSLYGTGALGGIYRIVSRRADLSQSTLDLSGGIGATASGGTNFDGSIVANLPLVEDVAGLRLVGYGERAAGWIDTGSRVNTNSAELMGLRGSLAIEPDAGWRIDLGGMGQWQNARDSSYTYAEGSRSRPAQFPEPHDNDLLHASLHAQSRGQVTLTWSSGYTTHEVRDTFDATMGAASFGLPDPRLMVNDARFTVWDSEFRASGIMGRVDWVAGISHIEAKQKLQRSLEARSGAALELGRERRSSVESALFGEASFPLVGRLDATIGGRAFLSKIEDDRRDGGNEGERHLQRLGFTPSAALSWRVNDRQMAYLRYGSAFRQGALALDEADRYEPLDGDELATVSAGWRYSTGLLFIETGLYRSWWHSVQSDVLRPGGRIETQNAGNGSILGVEVTLNAGFGRGWQLEAGGMAQSAMLDPNEAFSAEEDLRLPVVPNASLRAAVTNRFDFEDWHMSASARLVYSGSSRLSFDPALDRKVGAHWNARLGLTATQGLWSFDLAAENLFDSTSAVFAYGNPLRLPTSAQFVPEKPRRIRLTANFRG